MLWLGLKPVVLLYKSKKRSSLIVVALTLYLYIYMTVAEIMALALSNAHTKSNQVDSDDKLRWFNIIRKDIAKTIMKDVSENYFFEIWTIDAEDNETAERVNGEYLFPKASSTSVGMRKLMRLAIKGHSTDTYHTTAREVDPRQLEKDWSYYVKNQSKANPIYFIGDRSFFIAPEWKPDEVGGAGNKQIKAYGIASVADLASDANESAILVPEDYHWLISLGMEQYVFKSRGKQNEAINSMNEYEAKKSEMIDGLTNRDVSRMKASLPNDNNLQYGE